ncbi:MAG: sulfatase activating formylglycine-generating enzyme [Crocinitomicaceae bacterium]|jgi:formylglycine-generating enzyme required for sulfatase activity
MYKAINRPIPKLEIPGFVYIDPAQLASNNSLCTYSYHISLEKYFPFEYSTAYYQIINREKADSVIEVNKSNRESDYGLGNLLNAERNNSLGGFNLIHYVEPELARESRREREKQKMRERQRKEDSLWTLEHPNRERNYGNGIIDGIYIREGGYDPSDYYNLKIPYFNVYPEIEDSVTKAHSALRSNEIQPLIDSILSPFYMSRAEVTNKEYREFTNWVRDSIAREMIYAGLKEHNRADKFIDHGDYYNPNDPEDEWIAYDIYNKDLNRKTFNLNWDHEFNYEDPELTDVLAEMYYPQPERFYKRRDFDVRKFKYCFGDGSWINIYPDSMAFENLNAPDLNRMTNMYHWHPYYDNYPVVNVSYGQILAYCDWKQNQVNKALKDESIRVKISVPSIAQYEFALKHSVPYVDDNEVRDGPNSNFSAYRRENDDLEYYLNNVYRKFKNVHKKDDYIDRKSQVMFNRWCNENYNEEFRFINGNVSEIVLDPINSNSLNHYGVTTESPISSLVYVLGENYLTGVKSIGDDQHNATFYKTVARKYFPEATTGFRLIYSVSIIKG